MKKQKKKHIIKYTNDSPPILPNGFTIALNKKELMLTFFWNPPEDDMLHHVTSRTRLTRKMVKELGEIFTKEYKNLEDDPNIISSDI